MADFYYREVDPEVRAKIQGSAAQNRIRRNAYVVIRNSERAVNRSTGFYYDALPSTAIGEQTAVGQQATSTIMGFEDTYRPNSTTGKPRPILKDVEITLEGEAGSLRRASVSFTCFDEPTFNEYEKIYLRPNSQVIIAYGYVDGSDVESHEFRVYDFKFDITKEGWFDCSFKAVGKGSTYHEQDLSAHSTLASSWTGTKYTVDYNNFNETAPVTDWFSLMEMFSQRGFSDTWNTSDYEPPDGDIAIHANRSSDFDGCFSGVLNAPGSYDSETQLGTGKGLFGIAERLVYHNLRFLVTVINKYYLQPAGYTILFHPKYSAINPTPGADWYGFDYHYPIFSPDPYKMVFPYRRTGGQAGGKPVWNIYGKKNGPWAYTYNNEAGAHNGEPDTINLNKFHGSLPKIDTKNPCSNNTTNYNAQSMGGTKAGDPGAILLSRDFLIELQRAFSKDASDTKNDNKEPAKIKLNEFFERIFKPIAANSGGAWNLSLEQDEESTDELINGKYQAIYIVNKTYAGLDDVKPLVLQPASGLNGIRDLKIGASVPKDVQAKAFGGSPDVSDPNQNESKDMREVLENDDPDLTPVGTVQAEDMFDAQMTMAIKKFSQDAVDNARGVIREYINGMRSPALIKDEVDPDKMPFPLTFSATLDGVSGLKFGDTLTSDYLPARYRKDTGVRVVFTVTKYTHKIVGNDWTTDVTAYARIRG